MQDVIDIVYELNHSYELNPCFIKIKSCCYYKKNTRSNIYHWIMTKLSMIDCVHWLIIYSS